MTIQVVSPNEYHEPPRFMSFPGGERHVNLPASIVASEESSWTVYAQIYTPADIMDLLLVTDALRRAVATSGSFDLVLPYVPYARQDRVAVAGESLSAKVFCDLVNGLGFDSVTVSDPHSSVVPALLNNVKVITPLEHVRKLIDNVPELAGCVLVSPDMGARPRVQEIATALGREVLFCDKKRDPATGRLSGALVLGAIPEAPLLIVDDICDGGGTFIGLAEVLRKQTKQPLYLYTTHGLFTKGVAPLQPYFTGIYAPYCMSPEYQQDQVWQNIGASQEVVSC